MKRIIRIIKNNYKIIIGFVLGLIVSVSSVYAIDAYIESNKVTYNNHNKTNVEEAIDELYERSGIHKSKWVDKTLNGADPVLKEPLIPVEIKPNGEVYYANENNEWYNYSDKRWANAVILVDNPSNENYKVGDHIIEDDIESYFVWIPRYQYKIWDLGNYTTAFELSNLTDASNTSTAETSLWRIAGSNARIIDIRFGTYEKYPKMSEPSTTGVYYTHPAFTLGTKDLNGIWVGKFETGGSASNVIVKPNVNSWRNETVKVFFNTAKGFAKDLDSHMMKNTEWGAVAYLSHSEYGIAKKININNTSDYMTGYSAAPNTNQSTYPGETAQSTNETKTQPWNTPVGYLASTTGNISGIYDMSGGVGEYVAAYKQGQLGGSTFTQAEINAEVQAGYIEAYSDQSDIRVYKRILGDATGELGPFYRYYENDGTVFTHNSWYNETAHFFSTDLPWVFRGGVSKFGVIAGQFHFVRTTGEKEGNAGFRLVLAPLK